MKEKTLWVRFDWAIEPEVRHQVEAILTKNNYIIHGGGTNLVDKTADISLHKSCNCGPGDGCNFCGGLEEG